MDWTPAKILSILDRCCAWFDFPMLDNGYIYLAATRLSFYCCDQDWALVIEVFGFSPRYGNPIAVRINVRTFSNNEFLPPSTDESATRLYPLPTNQ